MTRMKQLLSERVELIARPYAQLRQQKNLSIVLILGVLALTLGVVWLAFRARTDREIDWGELATKLWEKTTANPWDSGFHLFILLVLSAHVLYLIYLQGRERLVLTRSGVEYRSPLPAWLQVVRKSWSLNWSEVRAIRLRPLLGGGGPQMIALEMETLSETRQLMPYYWVDVENFSFKPPWRVTLQDLRRNHEALAALIDDSPVMRYVTAALPHLPVERPQNLLRSGFAIEKNRAALTMTAAFFVLLAYALLDGGFLCQETYIEAVPYTIFAVIGVGVFAASGLWMFTNKVPIAEGIVIAMLAGGASAGTGYPALLRLNMLTDSNGLQTVTYELTGAQELKPVSGDAPALHFPQHYEYWSQFKKGSEHEFELRRGGLGFYQLNQAPYHARLRAYYEKHGR